MSPDRGADGFPGPPAGRFRGELGGPAGRRHFLRLALGALAAASCGRPQSGGGAPSPPPREDVLVVGRVDDPAGLDPGSLTDLESVQVAEALHDTLFRFGAGSLEPEPHLAESATMAPDGRSWRLRLRDGVRFHDGEALDAGAVAWNVQRHLEPDPAGGSFSAWGLIWGTPSKVTAVEAVDRRTVRFRLSEPVAPFLDNLALPYFGMVSPVAAGRWGQDLFRHPVGSGPFRFVEWAPRERLVVEANPRWFGGRPSLERIVFRPVADALSRQVQLQAGALHLVTQVQLESVDRLRADRRVRLATEPGMSVGFLALNNLRPPLDDVRVRRAVRCAVDVPALVDGLYRSLARPASSPLPPPVWGRLDRGPEPYDPEAARRLLAEAGYPEGFECELWYMSVARPYMPDPRAIAEALQAMLAEVGVRVELHTRDWSQYLDDTARGEADMCLLGWVGDSGDPDNYLFTLFDSQNIDTRVGGSNLFLYRNPEVDRLLETARARTSRREREPLYLQAQEILHEDAPWVPLAYADQVAAHHPALRGLRLHPSGSLRLEKVGWSR